MSKQPNTSQLTKILVAVIVAFAALYTEGLVLVIMAGVAVYFIWSYHDKIKEIERRLNASGNQPSDTGQTV